MTISLIISLASFSMVAYAAVVAASGLLKMKRLGDVQADNSSGSPRVSIVVPACNEEEHIEKAVLSLLVQEYDNLEIIIINDRSSDNTGAVLENVRRLHPELKIHTIAELSDGWMGKSHALAQGAKLATGEFLLFTDADVIMEKTTISRAVNYCVANQLDHLALLFKNTTRGWLLNSLILDSGMGLFLAFKPWKVCQRRSKYFIGIGAFNMVKKSVYRTIGGHGSIRMHPIDDVMLGKIIKASGYQQDCLMGQDYVVVPWYDSVREMVNGLLKNTFSVLHYRLAFVPLQLVLIFVVNIFPLLGGVLGEGLVQQICLFSLAVRLAAFYGGLKILRLPVWYLAGSFLTPFISAYIIAKSAYVTTIHNGIFWRGRFYPLRDLKKESPLFF